MRLLEVFSVLCFMAVCAAQDSLTEPVTVPPTVYVPPKPTLERQSPWSDVFPSETVELRCAISGSPDWTINWFRNDVKIENNPSWALSSDRSVLTITAQPNQSGKHSCQGVHKTKKNIETPHSNSLDVKVHGNPVVHLSKSPDFEPMFPGESITFKCTISLSSSWVYVWSHNGTEIPTSTSETYNIASLDHSNNGQYKCKAKRGTKPFYTGESEASLSISDPPVPSPKLLSPWPDVYPNEKVEMSCDVNKPGWKFTWHKKQTEVQEGASTDGKTLTIASVRAADAGSYTCKAHHTSRRVTSGFGTEITIKVYGDRPKTNLTRPDGYDLMYVGQTVNFNCTVAESSGWRYVWYKDGKELGYTTKDISIPLQLPDAGIYSCKARRGQTTETYESNAVSQEVIGKKPKVTLTQAPEYETMFVGERVVFTCEIDVSYTWEYEWDKDGQMLNNPFNVYTRQIGKDDDGVYKCRAKRGQTQTFFTEYSHQNLNIKEQKPTPAITQMPTVDTLYNGESVFFDCKVEISSGWEYHWLKNGSPISSHSSRFAIHNGTRNDDGEYSCKAVRNKTSYNTDTSTKQKLTFIAIPAPKLKKSTEWLEVFHNESVQMICGIEQRSDWHFTWYRDGKEIQPDDDDVSFETDKSALTIDSASDSHRGNYSCRAHLKARRVTSSFSNHLLLHVYGDRPKPTLTRTYGYDPMYHGETVELSCKVAESSGWTYVWYKDGKDLGYTTKDISIRLELSDPANYSCKARRGQTTETYESNAISQEVLDKPNVTLIQTPEHSLMHTDDKVTFLCHINISSGWEYQWYKDHQPSKTTTSTYTIDPVQTKDSGSYGCQLRRRGFKADSETIKLEVKERPRAVITLLTGWSEVFSTDTLVLRCEVKDSEHTWNYTWFKERNKIQETVSEKYTVTPDDDPAQSKYSCQGTRTGILSYTYESEDYKTKNLLLKRRVLLSISGCIFFGIIAVIIGCIALRVTRKPAPTAERPEETSLFLTMAELKNRVDAPSPLVDYITDEDIISPAKGEEEKGSICTETTPLPISTEDDQAATNENHSKEENGGMVSFK